MLLVAGGAAALLCLVFVLAGGPASAATVYVDDSYSGDNPASRQWTTVQKGIYDAAANDTVYVYNGTYFENVTIWNASVTLEGESRANVRIISNSTNLQILSVRNSFFTVRNVTLQAGARGVHGASVAAHNATIQNVTITGPATACVESGGASTWRVEDSFLNACGLYGFISTAPVNYGHRILNTTVNGSVTYDSIQLAYSRGAALDRISVPDAGRYALYLDLASEVSVSNFSLRGASSYTVRLYQSDDCVLQDGVLDGGADDGLFADSSNHNQLTNVTFVNHSAASRFNIQLYLSHGWVLRQVNITGAIDPLDLAYTDTYAVAYLEHDIDLTNTFNGLPIVFFSNATGGSYFGPAAALFVINSTGVTVGVNNTISGLLHGALFVQANNTTLEGLNASGNDINLRVRGSWDSTFNGFNQTSVTSGNAGLWVYGGGRNRFVGGTWNNTTTSYTAAEFRTTAANHTVDGVTCQGWNICVRFDSGSIDNAVVNATINGSYYGVYVYYATSWRVERTLISNAYMGIDAYSSGPGFIANVTVRSSSHTAIYLSYCEPPYIQDSVLGTHYYYGVFASNTPYGQLHDTIVENGTATDYGLLTLLASPYWTLRGVTLRNGTLPFDFNFAPTMAATWVNHDVDLTNTYQGQPIVYFANSTGGTYTGPAGLFVAVNSTGLNVSFTNSITGTYMAGLIIDTDNSTVSDFNASYCAVNLAIVQSQDNTVINFTQRGLRSGSWGGLLISYADRNVVRDAVWTNTSRSYDGAYVAGVSAGNRFVNVTANGWNIGFHFYNTVGSNSVEGSTLDSNYYGLYVNQGGRVMVSNTTFLWNAHSGMYTYYAEGPALDNATFANNYYYGLLSTATLYGTVQNSTFRNGSTSGYALLYLQASSFWTLRGNQFLNASNPIDFNFYFGIPMAYAQQDVDTSNTYNGVQIVWLTNASGTTFTGPASFLVSVNSTGVNVTLTGSIVGVDKGALILDTYNSTFRDMNISRCNTNLMIHRSADNEVVNFTQTSLRSGSYGGLTIYGADRNTVRDSVWVNLTRSYDASYISGSSTDNLFLNVTVSGWNTGFYMYFGAGPNRIESSTVTANYYGVYAYGSAPLTIANSTFSGQAHSGAYLYYTSGPRIINTSFTSNYYYGVLTQVTPYGDIEGAYFANGNGDYGLLELQNSPYWRLRNASFMNATNPLSVGWHTSLPMANAQHDVDLTNTYGGRPIVYLTNQSGTSYTGPVSIFFAVNSTVVNVTFTTPALAAAYIGAMVLDTSNSVITGLNSTSGYVNLVLMRSYDNVIANFSQSGVRSGAYGGVLFYESDRNSVRDSVWTNATGSNKAAAFATGASANQLLNVTVTGWNMGAEFYSTAADNRIDNSLFTNNYYAVYSYNSQRVIAANSTFRGQAHSAFYIYYTTGPLVENSTLANNYYYSFLVDSSSYGRVQDTRIENGTGYYALLRLNYAVGWTLRNVTFSNATQPLDLGWPTSVQMMYFQHDIDLSNTYNGRPIVYFSNATGASYAGPASLVLLVNSTSVSLNLTTPLMNATYWASMFIETSNSTVRGLNASNGLTHALLVEADNNTFYDISQGPVVSSSYAGILLYNSDANRFLGGNWTGLGNSNTAAEVRSLSDGNLFRGVRCTGYAYCFYFYGTGSANAAESSNITLASGYGVYIYSSGATRVENNSITATSGRPIDIEYAGGSLIANNNLSTTNGISLYALQSPNLRVEFNNITTATGWALYIDSGSSSALFHHNNFYLPNGATYDGNSGNAYDNGYPSGGNYWSNSTKVDLYSGPAQAAGGPDGINDSAQVLRYGEVDNYPLAEPWPPYITLVGPANNSFIQPGVTLDFAVSRYFDNINYSISNGSQLNFSAPFDINTSGWANGVYWIRVFGTDVTNISLSPYFVFTIDSTLPTIVANSPSPGGTYDVGTQLNFTVSDANLANNVTWNNGSGPNLLTSPWDISTVGWAEGTWNITIVAWDLSGNSRTATYLYRLDSTWPNITLSSPANNSVVPAGTVINLDVSDTFLVSVTWSNGGSFAGLSSPYDISMGGWASGTYNVTVVAVDLAGHTTVVVYTFTLDSVAPQITLVTPGNNTAVSSGTALDIEIVELNLQSASFDIGFGLSSFAAPYNISTFGWSDGTYDIEVWADDTAGNAAYARFRIYIDSTPPSVSAPSVPGGGLIPGGSLLPFNVSDANLVGVVFNNGSGNTTLASPYAVNTTGWADGNYTVVVYATDAAGYTSSASVNVTIDSTPPTVVLVTPTNGTVLQPGTTLNFTISDAHLNWTTWDNGSGAQSFASAFEISTDGWSDGLHTITVQAEDLCGNLQSVEVWFIVDGTPPTIVLNSPANGSTISVGDALDLSVTDTNLVSATWDNGSGAVGFSSPFDINTSAWAGGLYTITVYAVDGAGNAASFSFTVRVDTAPPSILLVSPANGSYVVAGTAIVFNITDTDLASATWSNGSTPQTFGAPFAVPTTGWQDGTYTIEVNATDGAGNVATLSVLIRIDSTAPAVTLTSPASGSFVRAGTTLDITVVEANLETATWNIGGAATSFPSPFDIATSGWADGAYSISVRVADLAGSVTWLNFTITVDSTPPSVSLTSPSNDSAVQGGTTIVISITDTNLNLTTWNNGSGAQAFAANFTISMTGWTDGLVTVTIVAGDRAGNSVSRWYQFLLDSTPPDLSLVSPAAGAVVRPGTTIDIDVWELHREFLRMTNSTGEWEIPPPFEVSTTGWAEGLHTLSVVCQDLAGNRDYLNFTIIIDSIAPTITLLTPSNNSTVRAGTPIQLNLSDANGLSATWNNVTSGDLAFSTQWVVPTTGWIDRAYNITVRATDLAGNNVTRVFRFTIDSIRPQLTLVGPANDTWMRAGERLIDFTIIDANPLTVDLAGAPTAFTGSYDLDTTTWPDGTYALTIRAADPADNNVTLSVVYHIDSTVPAISAGVAAGSVIPAGTPLLFTFTEANLFSAQWRNSATGLFTNFPTNFSIPTAGWPDGPVEIVVRAVDRANNSLDASFNYTIDSTDPSLSILAPSNWTFVQGSTSLELSVVDATVVAPPTVYIGGLEVTAMMGPSGTWLISLTGLPEGLTDLYILSTDAAGNSATLSGLFTIDSTAPILPASLVSQAGNEDSDFTLNAAVVDALASPDDLTLQWSFDPDDPFQSEITLAGNNATWVFMTPGQYNISLNVTDPAGNSNNTTYNILIFDTTPPNVSDWNDYIQWDEDVAFNLSIVGTDNGNGTLNYTWSSPQANFTTSGPNISWVFPTPGVYAVTLFVSDPSGNTVAQYALFNISDRTAPDAAIVGPLVVDLLQTANFTANVSDNDPRTSYANWTMTWRFTNLTGSTSQSGRNASFTTGASHLVTVNLTVVDASGNVRWVERFLQINVPPLVIGAGPPAANVSEEWSWTVDTFDPELGGPVPITIVFGPSGMTVEDNTIHWTPGANQTGAHNVTIEFTDGQTTVQKTFTLYVGDPAGAAGNRPPYFVSVPLQDARVNHLYDYTFEARDPDGNNLQYFLAFASEVGFELNEQARNLRWFPPWHPVGDEPFMRNVSISLIAFDGYAYANQSFVIRFRNPPNQWPILQASAALPPLGLNQSHSFKIANYWMDPDDPLDVIFFAQNGTFEERQAVAGKVEWYVDRTTEGGPYLVITARSIGTYRFNLVAKDPSGGTSENNTFEITVGSANAPGAQELPWWLIAALLGGVAVAGVGAAVAIRRSRTATQVAHSALETASKAPQAVVQPAEPLPAKGTKKDTYVIEAVFIIYDDGRLIFSKTDISDVKFEDPALVASMFSAVQSFIQDSFQQSGELDRLGFGENTIMIERGQKTFMACVIFGQPTQDLVDGMKDTLSTIENAYAGIIEEWDGSVDSLEGIDQYVMPFLATTAHLTRKDVQLALTEKGVKMLSELEFFQGFVRLKCGVKNDTDSVITKVTVSIDFNEDVLRLHHIEPETYKKQGSEVQLGVLNPQEKASVAYYFDPQICTESMIDGIARYRDAKGAVHSVNMKTRKAEVVCPIFFTKEHANTAMLKRLVESVLDQRDSKVYSVDALPAGMAWKDVFGLLKDVVLSHDVHLVRDFIREEPYHAEVWFYGETKVKGYKIVIRASVQEEMGKVEFFAASTHIPAITGLLAEFNHTLQNLTKSKHQGLVLVPEFDEQIKHEVEKKSLMPKMQDSELESGETEQ